MDFIRKHYIWAVFFITVFCKIGFMLAPVSMSMVITLLIVVSVMGWLSIVYLINSVIYKFTIGEFKGFDEALLLGANAGFILSIDGNPYQIGFLIICVANLMRISYKIFYLNKLDVTKLEHN